MEHVSDAFIFFNAPNIPQENSANLLKCIYHVLKFLTVESLTFSTLYSKAGWRKLWARDTALKPRSFRLACCLLTVENNEVRETFALSLQKSFNTIIIQIWILHDSYKKRAIGCPRGVPTVRAEVYSCPRDSGAPGQACNIHWYFYVLLKGFLKRQYSPRH